MSLRCIGRTDGLGDPNECGSFISFIHESSSATARISITAIEAEALLNDLALALEAEANKKKGRK